MNIKHSVSHSVIVALFSVGFTACGGGGSSSGGTTSPPPPPPPVADNTAPTLNFNPSTTSVVSGQSQSIVLSSSDNVGITSGPSVTCTNGGSFSAGVFTAAVVTADTASVCTATAQDAAGNEGTATLTVTMTPDVSGPTLTVSQSSFNLASGESAPLTITATDNGGVASGPTVSCSNGGSFANGVFTAPVVTVATTTVCTVSATDSAGNVSMETFTVSLAPATVTLSGTATYDFVPHISNSSTFRVFPTALDYDSIQQRPIRGATAELVDASGTVLDITKTDATGAYSFELDPNANVRVRIKAEMVQTSGAQWNVRVQDNTNSDALYALQGALQSSGTADSTRDLNAGSGWGGSSYTSPRQAAPFAIMDPIYDAVTQIAAHDPDVVFPLAKFNWSVNNIPVSGTLANGEITTSSYRGNGDIYILGAENNDTDEYDIHVVVHEWGHYFEDQLSRSDSIGGSHGGEDRLDPRVAMGEGFGNALSGMIIGDSVYRDSDDAGQASGFALDVEDNDVGQEGWFNETSVQSILYDIFDSASDGGDTLSLGIGPIYDVFVSDSYKETPYFTTIFAYLDEFKTQFPANAAAIDVLAADRNVNGIGPDGAGETSNGTVPSALPVYNVVNVNGGPVEICSVDDQGTYNMLGNRAYVAFNVTAPGAHTLTMTRNAATSTATNRDPDFLVYRNETFLGVAESGDTDTEQASISLAAGLHRVDAYDFFNLGITGTRGDSCYNFTVTR